MTQFRMDPNHLDKWMHQNKAEYQDFVPGVLLDNLLVVTKRGAAVLLDNYINGWSSDYMVYFGSFKSGDAYILMDGFDEIFDRSKEEPVA